MYDWIFRKTSNKKPVSVFRQGEQKITSNKRNFEITDGYLHEFVNPLSSPPYTTYKSIKNGLGVFERGEHLLQNGIIHFIP